MVARPRKLRCWLGRVLSPSFGWLLEIADIIWLAATELQSLPVFPLRVFTWRCLSACVCFCVSSPFMKPPFTLNEGTTLLHIQCDLILTYILITSAKTLFPNKITFTDTRDYYFNSFGGGGQNSAHSSRVDRSVKKLFYSMVCLWNGLNRGLAWCDLF